MGTKLLSSKTVMQDNGTTGTMDVEMMNRGEFWSQTWTGLWIHFACNGLTGAIWFQLVKENVGKGSLIPLDEWSAYNNLNVVDYYHFTVNH